MNFPCPLCGRPLPVRINKRDKPYLRCQECGVLMFVNNRAGIDALQIPKPIVA